MKLRKFTLVLILFLLFNNITQAQKTINQCCQGVINFIENKNQWDENIRYKVELTSTSIFMENDGITYFFEDREAVRNILRYKLLGPDEKLGITPPSTLVNYHAYKVFFKNANKNARTTSYYPTSDYINYYIGNDESKWAAEVGKFKQIKYHDLWPHIDLLFYEHDHLLKYDFIVGKQANVKDIVLSYEGQDNITLNARGHLIIKTSVNEITELKPYSYQIINNDTVVIPSKFKLKNNELSFEFPKGYNKDYELIIDPTLIFSTYSGSTSDNWGYTATYDYHGFVYAAGIAMGIGYPFTLGAFQQTFGGAYCDISITKYDTTGSSLIYSTLLGGNGPEIPHSIFVNNSNELFVFGTTGSNNFPVTANAYDNTFNGGTPYIMTNVLNYSIGSDIIVARFNATGTALLASTYLGGSGNDGLSSAPPLRHNYADEARGEVFIDEQNNCWIVSSTQSQNFPVTANAFQTTFGGGQQDGVIIKMDNDLTTLIWSSFFGGSGNDAVYSITIDDNDGHIYVSGGTSSTNFPVTAGSLQTTYNGGVCDGYIAKIHRNGSQILHSTYFGSNAYDQIYFVERDKLGFVYVFGQTRAIGNTFIHNALWATPSGGQFVSKLGAQLDTLIWSTAFGTGGGVPNISPTAFLVDLCNNIYLSGWGGAVNGFGGTNGLPITANAFQSTTNNSDFYLLVITDDASSLVYATYFGGAISNDHVDGGTSRFDKKGIIYQSMCAGCGGQSDTPTTPGSWSQTNNSFNCNNAVFKMDFGLPITIADFIVPPILCAPATLNFVNTSTVSNPVGVVYYWDFGDGSNSSAHSPTHTYINSGIYDVTLIVNDTNSCNFSDTITKQVIVLSNTSDTLPTVVICDGDYAQIGITPMPVPNITYTWTPTTGLSSSTVPNPIASPSVSTNYMLLVSNNICTDTLYQRVEIDNINVFAGNDTTVCQGSIILTAISNQSGNSFVWSTNPQFTDTLNTPPNSNTAIINVSGSQMYYVQAYNQNCQAIDSVYVTISNLNISVPPGFNLCVGNTAQLNVTNLVPSNPLNYTWAPTGSIISGGNTATPTVNPTVSTTYTVSATDAYGCSASAQIAVNVINLQLTHQLNNVTCYQYCNGNITVNPSGGGLPYNYVWSNGQTAQQAVNLCAGSYTVTITDMNNCSLTHQVQITEPPALSVLIVDTVHVVCNGICDGEITVIGNGGTPPYTYYWISGQSTPTIIGLCAGIYTVTVTDFLNCTTALPVQINDTSNFDAWVNFSNVSCYGDCDAQAQAYGLHGLAPYTYQWGTGATTDNINNLCAGVYNVTVTEGLGCMRNVYITVTQPSAITSLTNVLNNPFCYNDCNGQAHVNANGGTPPYTFLWSDGHTNSQNSFLCAGLYTVTITDTNNCSIVDSVLLTQPTPLELDITTSNVPCVEVCNGVASITANGSTPPYTYLWSNGATTQTITNLCAGNYTVTVLDVNSCNDTEHAYVEDVSILPPTFSITADKDTIYPGQSVQLTATQLNDFSYSWAPSGSLNNATIYNPIASPNQTTTYILTLEDEWGCVYKDTIIIYVIEVICDESNIFIPNAFSPNNDNFNDVLFVRGVVIDELYLTIYNRWGEKVFETRNISDGWDGTYKGQMSEPGVYVYYLEVICFDKQEFFKKGNITLLR